MSIGVIGIGRLVGQPDKDASHHVIGNIRNRVYAFRQQGRAVTENANQGFDYR
jgi:hypothetical protein